MSCTLSVARYCVFAAAAAACAVAVALRPIEQEKPNTGSAPQGTAYLDCARIQPQRVREPDLVAPCSVLASTAKPRPAT